MAYNFQDRISALKNQTDDLKIGRLRPSTAFFRAGLPLIFAAFLFQQIGSAFDDPNAPELSWEDNINQQFEERLGWLQATPFILSPGGARMYEQFGKGVVSTLHKKSEKHSITDDLLDLQIVVVWMSEFFTERMLRGGFVFFAIWPLWIIGFVLGLYAFRKGFAAKRTEDFLGICDRGVGPFYSGIYGPLRSNNSFSATDYTCPNLACPTLASPESVAVHELGKMLKHYEAENQTNIDLARVILQYRDFPAFVESEQAADDEVEVADLDEPQRPASITSTYITNAGGTIEQSAKEGLLALLNAHQVFVRYVAEAQRQHITPAQLNSSYAAHTRLLEPLTQGLSPFAKLLTTIATPNRALAIGRLPAALIATAYLAIEAGKVLVYKRDGKDFSKISRYPHLQARSIMQSLGSFGQDYNGDSRLIIRQSIICSRRHGDFGRAFLPERMAVEARAIRDWLELFYAEPKRRESVASLIELDAHVEEISVNWRSVYSRRVRLGPDAYQRSAAEPNPNAETSPFWKGVIYKSVVLVPLSEVVGMALRAVDEHRVKRISHLLTLAQKNQTAISISARLPGFKRQVVEALNTAQLLAEGDTSKGLMDRWVIVRHMLSRYNWLSTRIGDDAVPPGGFVQAIILHSNPLTQRSEVSGYDMMVPIRQRRYEELFGKQWEAQHYLDSPSRSQLKVFVDRERYLEAFRREREILKKLGGGVSKPPSVASA